MSETNKDQNILDLVNCRTIGNLCELFSRYMKMSKILDYDIFHVYVEKAHKLSGWSANSHINDSLQIFLNKSPEINILNKTYIKLFNIGCKLNLDIYVHKIKSLPVNSIYYVLECKNKLQLLNLIKCDDTIYARMLENNKFHDVYDAMICVYTNHRIEIKNIMQNIIQKDGKAQFSANFADYMNKLIKLNYVMTLGDSRLIKQCPTNNIKFDESVTKLLLDKKKNERCYNLSVDNISSIMDAIMECGYKISLVDIKLLAQKMYYVNNVDKLGIPIKDILDLQTNIEYFPYDIKNGKLVGTPLYAYIKENYSLTDIKKDIKKDNLVPNQRCMKLVCSKDTNNKQIVQYFIETHKLKITEECMVAHFTTLSSVSATTGYIISNYKKPTTVKYEHVIKIEDIINTTNKQNNVSNIDNIIGDETNNNNIPIINNNIIAATKLVPKIIVTNKKNCVNVDDNIKKTLKLKKNVVGFIELKKNFIQYIKDNKLLDNNIIKMNEFTSKLCGLGLDDTIDFDQIENLITYCIIG